MERMKSRRVGERHSITENVIYAGCYDMMTDDHRNYFQHIIEDALCHSNMHFGKRNLSFDLNIDFSNLISITLNLLHT